jgi:hypothetical protein
MRVCFPNIRYFLLVGITGGVPRYRPAGAASEIVLGDVVVSSPPGNHGGVVQYEKGAWQGSGRLNFREHTNGVPGDLMAAVNNFRAKGWSKTNIVINGISFNATRCCNADTGTVKTCQLCQLLAGDRWRSGRTMVSGQNQPLRSLRSD